MMLLILPLWLWLMLPLLLWLLFGECSSFKLRTTTPSLSFNGLLLFLFRLFLLLLLFGEGVYNLIACIPIAAIVATPLTLLPVNDGVEVVAVVVFVVVVGRKMELCGVDDVRLVKLLLL